MIKYLGSKRRLAPVIADLAEAVAARSALDLFSGSTRVSRALKERGLLVTAVDSAEYAAVLAEGLVAVDGTTVDRTELDRSLKQLNALPGRAGYVTETFCRSARFFQEPNGERIDAIRDAIEDYRGTAWFPLLLTSLLLAADKVDSTTGVQMAYLKQWAPRSHRPLELVAPALLPGPGRAVRGDASATARRSAAVDFAYLDPPYNQHRYESNYHVWDTLVRWDAPVHYGVACKRVDLRDPGRRSSFNSRRTFPEALRDVISAVRATTVVVSYNDESWVDRAQIEEWLRAAGHEAVGALGFASARYIGARIGIHGPDGRRVGEPGRLHNMEWLIIGTRAAHLSALLAAGVRHDGVVLPEGAPVARPGELPSRPRAQ